MAHVSYLAKDQADASVRPIYDGVEQKLGSMLNIFKTMAHAPELFQAFMGLNGALAKTKLDGKLRELAYLAASQANGCDYCLHYHRKLGQKAGLSERQVMEIDRLDSSEAYDDLARDVVRFAQQVSRDTRADDAVMGRLKEALSERELVELAMTVALANFTNRINHSMGVELP